MNITLEYIEESKDYYISSTGWVYRKIGEELKLIKGWINVTKKRYKPYRRCWITYKDGSFKQQYNHMLVAIYFDGGDKRSEGLIVLHGENGQDDNSATNIKWGTVFENQTTDRKRDGNYNNRGGKKYDEKEDCPF